MTTKQFILDLLDEKEERVRGAYRCGKIAPGTDSANQRAIFGVTMGQIERARALVEKGPDEP